MGDIGWVLEWCYTSVSVWWKNIASKGSEGGEGESGSSGEGSQGSCGKSSECGGGVASCGAI